MRLTHVLAASALALLLSVNAEAQFTNSRSSSRSSSSRSSSVSVSDGWNQFTLQYKPDCLYWEENTDFDGAPNFNALNIEYGRAINVASIPLYLMPVIGLQWTFLRYDHDEDDYSFDMLAIRPGVNFGYLIELGAISLFPYVGTTTRINLWGECKDEYTYHDETETDTFDLFNGDDEDDGLNRFQIGSVLGIDAYLGKFVFGLSYGYDFNYFQKGNDDYLEVKTRNEFTFKVGLMF